MQFLDKETCQKLIDIGCSSESGFAWYHPDGMSDDMNYFIIHESNDEFYKNVERFVNFEGAAFTLLDFVSNEDYAKENCKKLWPGIEYYYSAFSDPELCENWKRRRHKLIDGNWQQIIKDALINTSSGDEK